MNLPNPSRWPELFEQAVAIIDQTRVVCVDDWSFGGGTALMLQIGHRDSHDIDIFVSDAQILPLLNPETQGHRLSLAPDGYETDGARALKIIFDGVGEIDFICCPHLTDHPSERTIVQAREINCETPAEIIAKKIVFRGKRLQPRDMFDIAAASIVVGEDDLVASLRPFADASRAALNVARGMNPDLAREIMGKLMARPDFSTLHLTAQDTSCRVLERIAAPAHGRA